MSERDSGILAAVARWLLGDSGLSEFLWGELMQTATYLLNWVPHLALGMVTPHKTHQSRIRIVSARVFVHEERSTGRLAAKA